MASGDKIKLAKYSDIENIPVLDTTFEIDDTILSEVGISLSEEGVPSESEIENFTSSAGGIVNSLIVYTGTTSEGYSSTLKFWLDPDGTASVVYDDSSETETFDLSGYYTSSEVDNKIGSGAYVETEDTVTTLADIANTGVYRWVYTTSDRPDSVNANAWGTMLHQDYGSNNYASQLLHDFQDDSLYFRKLSSGVASDYITITTSNNIGSYLSSGDYSLSGTSVYDNSDRVLIRGSITSDEIDDLYRSGIYSLSGTYNGQSLIHCNWGTDDGLQVATQLKLSYSTDSLSFRRKTSTDGEYGDWLEVQFNDEGKTSVGYTGGDPSTGNVGELLSVSDSSTSLTDSDVTYTPSSLTLTAGIWLVSGNIYCDDNTAVGGWAKAVVDISASFTTSITAQIDTGTLENDFSITPMTRYIQVTSDTEVYLCYSQENVRDATWSSRLEAVRIA